MSYVNESLDTDGEPLEVGRHYMYRMTNWIGWFEVKVDEDEKGKLIRFVHNDYPLYIDKISKRFTELKKK